MKGNRGRRSGITAIESDALIALSVDLRLRYAPKPWLTPSIRLPFGLSFGAAIWICEFLQVKGLRGSEIRLYGPALGGGSRLMLDTELLARVFSARALQGYLTGASSLDSIVPIVPRSFARTSSATK